ncbi:MAG: hypothetical protein Q9227_004904, partial [Pyrenula ochraceoflavens]
MDAKADEPRKCPGIDCANDSEHKALHKSTRNPIRKFLPPSIVSEPDPETGLYNPFPTFPFTGSLRPVYPLSERRKLPDSVVKPVWHTDGQPKYSFTGRNKITILDKKGQDGMRKVCKLAREVLDIAARELRPGVTTDHIDEVVHNACIERN